MGGKIEGVSPSTKRPQKGEGPLNIPKSGVKRDVTICEERGSKDLPKEEGLILSKRGKRIEKTHLTPCRGGAREGRWQGVMFENTDSSTKKLGKKKRGEKHRNGTIR